MKAAHSMNFWNDPENDPLKVIILVAVIVVAGFFVFKHFQKNPLSGKGLVIDTTSSWIRQTGSGSHPWQAVTSSADGSKLVALAQAGYIYTSSDSGVTWIQRTLVMRNWTAVTSSADGVRLAATENGNIYTSNDSGVSWTPHTPLGTHSWISIASSADGTKLVALDCGSGGGGGYIYTSTDSGATWLQRTGSGIRPWVSVASSSDGIKFVATAGLITNDYVYTSIDGGATWTTRTSSGLQIWRGVTSSADGSKLAAIGSGSIYHSNDSGATWTVSSDSVYYAWESISSSADGSTLIAGDQSESGFIYISTDGANTWSRQMSAGTGAWTATAISANGTKFVAADVGTGVGGYIWTLSSSTGASPVVVTLPATSITATSAALNGNIISTGGGNVHREFVYFAPGMTGGILYSIDIGLTGGIGPYRGTLTDLSCGTTYHYIADATNAYYIAGHGSDVYFTTLPCPVTIPSVLTVSANSITPTGATLKGHLSSLGGAMNADIGIDVRLSSSTTWMSTPMSTVTATGDFTRTMTGLLCNTNYIFRAHASNTAGHAYGVEFPFKTSPCPTLSVTTSSGYGVDPYRATIFGILTSLGGAPSATFTFTYGTVASGVYTTPITTTVTPASSTTTPTTFSTTLTGLTCNTAYKFMPKVVTTGGTATGVLASFTTLTCPATVSTISPATGITSTGAIIKGNLSSLGGFTNPSVGFEYSPSPIMPTTTVRVTTGILSSPNIFPATLSGLTSHKLYFYRAWVHDPAYPVGSSYSYATIYGAWGTFTTL